MYKLGDVVKVERKAFYDASSEAHAKILHDFLSGIAPAIEYDLIALDTQEKLNACNEQNSAS